MHGVWVYECCVSVFCGAYLWYIAHVCMVHVVYMCVCMHVHVCVKGVYMCVLWYMCNAWLCGFCGMCTYVAYVICMVYRVYDVCGTRVLCIWCICFVCGV